MKRPLANRQVAALVLVLVAADWLSKLWIMERMAVGDSWTLVDGWLYFVHRQNAGVAFSFFSKLPSGLRVPMLSVLSFGGIVVFIAIVRSTDDRLAQFAGATVIAGALGNMGDRFVSGEVTDFVFVAFFPYVFNLADVAITMGGTLLMVRLALADDGEPDPLTGSGQVT